VQILLQPSLRDWLQLFQEYAWVSSKWCRPSCGLGCIFTTPTLV
jgi:hypothetical protein